MTDTADTATLVKLLREAGVRCAASTDLKLPSRVVMRRGGDLWLGSIWILEHVALPLVLSVLASVVARDYMNDESTDNTELDSDDRADIEIRIKEDDGFSTIRFSGCTRRLERILGTLGIDDTDEA